MLANLGPFLRNSLATVGEKEQEDRKFFYTTFCMTYHHLQALEG